jgi:hypothetical protein
MYGAYWIAYFACVLVVSPVLYSIVWRYVGGTGPDQGAVMLWLVGSSISTIIAAVFCVLARKRLMHDFGAALIYAALIGCLSFVPGLAIALVWVLLL